MTTTKSHHTSLPVNPGPLVQAPQALCPTHHHLTSLHQPHAPCSDAPLLPISSPTAAYHHLPLPHLHQDQALVRFLCPTSITSCDHCLRILSPQALPHPLILNLPTDGDPYLEQHQSSHCSALQLNHLSHPPTMPALPLPLTTIHFICKNIPPTHLPHQPHPPRTRHLSLKTTPVNPTSSMKCITPVLTLPPVTQPD